MKCFSLVRQLDALSMPNEAAKYDAMVSRGVQVKWLRHSFLSQMTKEERQTIRTFEVLEKYILPATQSTRMRYCELAPRCAAGPGQDLLLPYLGDCLPGLRRGNLPRAGRG